MSHTHENHLQQRRLGVGDTAKHITSNRMFKTRSTREQLFTRSKVRRPRVTVIFEDHEDGSVSSKLSYQRDEDSFGMTPMARLYRNIFLALATLSLSIALYFPHIVLQLLEPPEGFPQKKLRLTDLKRKNTKGLITNADEERSLSSRKVPDSESDADFDESNMDFEEFILLQEQKKHPPIENLSFPSINATPGGSILPKLNDTAVESLSNKLNVSSDVRERNNRSQNRNTQEPLEDAPPLLGPKLNLGPYSLYRPVLAKDLGIHVSGIPSLSPRQGHDHVNKQNSASHYYSGQGQQYRTNSNNLYNEYRTILEPGIGHDIHSLASQSEIGRDYSTQMTSPEEISYVMKQQNLRDLLTSESKDAGISLGESNQHVRWDAFVSTPWIVPGGSTSHHYEAVENHAIMESPSDLVESKSRWVVGLTSDSSREANNAREETDDEGIIVPSDLYEVGDLVTTGNARISFSGAVSKNAVPMLDPTTSFHDNGWGEGGNFPYDEKGGWGEDGSLPSEGKLGWRDTSYHRRLIDEPGFREQPEVSNGSQGWPLQSTEQVQTLQSQTNSKINTFMHPSIESKGLATQVGNEPRSLFQPHDSNNEEMVRSSLPYEPGQLSVTYNYQEPHLGDLRSSHETTGTEANQLTKTPSLDQASAQLVSQKSSMLQEQQGFQNEAVDTHQENLTLRSPSHLKICRIVMGQGDEPFLQEHKLCLDEFGPTEPLAEIFLSAFLAHYARSHGYRAEYDHNCGRHRSDQRLIQELLSSPLLVPESSRYHLSRAHLEEFCKMIVDAEQRNHESSAVKILLWDSASTSGDGTLENSSEIGPIPTLERLLPTILANMHGAAMKSRVVPTSLKAGYGVLKGRDASSEHLATGRAVIYLPCRDYDCEDLALVPYNTYILHLPLSVHVVDVVVSPRCMDRLPGCKRYVNDLASMVRQFSPEMSVEVIPGEPSSPDVIARLLEAEHVLCGPGFGMVCLFPSLGRDSGRVTLFDVGPNEVDGFAASSFVSRLPPSIVNHITPPLSAFSVAFLSDFGGHEELMVTFAQLPPNKDAGDCRFFRGRVGRWNQDMTYAERAQYRMPLSHYSGNAEKFFQRKIAKGVYDGLKYRPPTTYRFDEARYQTCAATLTTQESVCSLLKSLGVQRIFVLGDSLSLQMAQSMWMWLTNSSHGDSPTTKGSLDPNFKTTLQCMGYGSYTLQFVRNDELLENEDPVSIDDKQQNCKTYCYPWTKSYQEDRSRTILIFNVGAHLHEMERYTTAIDRFVDVFDTMDRPNDLVLFRTLVPGHWECSRPNLRPFANFAAYKKDAEEHPNTKEGIYTWGMFREYNDYAISKLDYRRFEPLPPGETKALMEVVDVFPMTVLRPDGHCSDEFRPPSYLDSDCLHYDLPGPVDWWTHMVFSHLEDIAKAENFLAQQVV